MDKPRSFIKGKLFALTMVAAIGGVGLTSWVATAAISVLSAYTEIIPGSARSGRSPCPRSAYSRTPRPFSSSIDSRRDVRSTSPMSGRRHWSTALLWELTRRLVAFYLTQNNMVSGYGPVGAAMALLFWVYVSSIILLLGAEISYAIAKERRQILPGKEMVVVAAPGEQPTPKFAPQVGHGFDDAREREPIVGVPSLDVKDTDGDAAGRSHRAPRPATRARRTGTVVDAATPAHRAGTRQTGAVGRARGCQHGHHRVGSAAPQLGHLGDRAPRAATDRQGLARSAGRCLRADTLPKRTAEMKPPAPASSRPSSHPVSDFTKLRRDVAPHVPLATGIHTPTEALPGSEGMSDTPGTSSRLQPLVVATGPETPDARANQGGSS